MPATVNVPAPLKKPVVPPTVRLPLPRVALPAVVVLGDATIVVLFSVIVTLSIVSLSAELTVHPVTPVSSLVPPSTPVYEQVPSTPVIVKVPCGPKSATDF